MSEDMIGLLKGVSILMVIFATFALATVYLWLSYKRSYRRHCNRVRILGWKSYFTDEGNRAVYNINQYSTIFGNILLSKRYVQTGSLPEERRLGFPESSTETEEWHALWSDMAARFFLSLSRYDLDYLARFISDELSGGVVGEQAIGEFLFEEQKLVTDRPEMIGTHIVRLEKFLEVGTIA